MATTRCQYSFGRGGGRSSSEQVSVEQVSSDDYWMAVPGEGVRPMSGVKGGWGRSHVRYRLGGKVQCIKGNGHMPPPTPEQIPVKTLPSRNFICGQ